MSQEAMTEWIFFEKICSANISVTVNVFHNTHQVGCYHFFIVGMIDESVNLTQMSK